MFWRQSEFLGPALHLSFDRKQELQIDSYTGLRKKNRFLPLIATIF